MWKEIKPRKQLASQSKEKNEYRYLARIDDMVKETKAVKAFASWGYFDYPMKGEGYENGFQLVPVNWEISSPHKKAFFNKLEEITGGSEF